MFIVSDQSGVGRGYFSLAEVMNLNQHLLREFGLEGVHFEKIYVAPEVPGRPSRGRKPSPQFLFDAWDEFCLDLAESYMIGDKLADLECGWNAGIKESLLVRTGYGAEVVLQSPAALQRAVIGDNLPGAAEWILARSNKPFIATKIRCSA